MPYIKKPKDAKQAREYAKWLAKGVGHHRALAHAKRGKVVTSFTPNLDGS